MNLLASAPAWLAAILYVLLVIAALEDGWRMRIGNLTSGAIAIGAFVAIALDGPIVGLWQNLLLFVGVLAIGTIFSLRAGGGCIGGRPGNDPDPSVPRISLVGPDIGAG